jgi:hypothetical protein
MRTIRSVHVQQSDQAMPLRFPTLIAAAGTLSSNEFAQRLADPGGFRTILHAIVADFNRGSSDGAMVEAALAVIAVNLIGIGYGGGGPIVFEWRGLSEVFIMRISAVPIEKAGLTIGDCIAWTEHADHGSAKIQVVVEGSADDILKAASMSVDMNSEKVILGDGATLAPDDLDKLSLPQTWLRGALRMCEKNINGMDAMRLTAAAMYLWGRMKIIGMQEANIENTGIFFHNISRGHAHVQAQRFLRSHDQEQGFFMHH